MSLEARKKLSEQRKGKNNPMYGKKPNAKQLAGLKKGWDKETWRQNWYDENGVHKYGKNTVFKAGNVPWNKGIKGERNGMYGRKHTEKAKAIMRETRLKTRFELESKQERILHDLLDSRDTEFETHVPLPGKPDVFIKPNVCVFLDGEYWHANPKTFCSNYLFTKKRKVVTAQDIWDYDESITKELEDRGYVVLRFWQDDFEKNPELMLESILISGRGHLLSS